MRVSLDEADGQRLLAIPSRERLVQVLGYMLDENEFLSPFGVRSMSRFHADHPYVLPLERAGITYRVQLVAEWNMIWGFQANGSVPGESLNAWRQALCGLSPQLLPLEDSR